MHINDSILTAFLFGTTQLPTRASRDNAHVHLETGASACLEDRHASSPDKYLIKSQRSSRAFLTHHQTI